MYDLVDSSRRHTNVLGETVLSNSHRFKELRLQDFPRMNRFHLCYAHQVLLVVIHYLHVVRITCLPAEAYPPLIINPDAVLSIPIVLELLQSIPGRNREICKSIRCVENQQLSESRPRDVWGPPADGLSQKETLGLTISEALNHAGI
jgi:hypothetical protein